MAGGSTRYRSSVVKASFHLPTRAFWRPSRVLTGEPRAMTVSAYPIIISRVSGASMAAFTFFSSMNRRQHRSSCHCDLLRW